MVQNTAFPDEGLAGKKGSGLGFAQLSDLALRDGTALPPVSDPAWMGKLQTRLLAEGGA